jgi:hypothetical protein
MFGVIFTPPISTAFAIATVDATTIPVATKTFFILHTSYELIIFNYLS